MACRCAPALLALRDEINTVWPHRDKASDGCCGDAAHAARVSDHNPDKDGYAHAFDIDENVTDSTDAAPLMWLWDRWVKNPDLRIKYLIYERRIFFASTGAVLAYKGANAHEHHLHVSITPASTHDTSPWGIAPPVGPSAPVKPGDGIQKPNPQPPAPDPEDDVPSPTDIVGVLDCDLPPIGGLAPHWRVQRNGGIQAVNGAPDYGSLLTIGVARADVIGLQHRHDQPGYVILCGELFEASPGKWAAPTYAFPTT